jgi:hypothetical protein
VSHGRHAGDGTTRPELKLKQEEKACAAIIRQNNRDPQPPVIETPRFALDQ